MRRVKRLTVRQLAFLGNLFGGKLSEQQALKKHNVSRRLYSKWLTEPAFAEQFDQRIAGLYRQNALLIARKADEAADALLKLAKEGTGEAARKACLDIISMHRTSRSADSSSKPGKKDAPPPEPPKLSPQTASKLLAVLAEEK